MLGLTSGPRGWGPSSLAAPVLPLLHVGLSRRLGSPVLPFCPSSLRVPLLKASSRKKGTCIIKWLLGQTLKKMWEGTRGFPTHALGLRMFRCERLLDGFGTAVQRHPEGSQACTDEVWHVLVAASNRSYGQC